MEQTRKRHWISGALILVFFFTALGGVACWLLQSPAFDAFLLSRLPRWAAAAGVRLELQSLDVDPLGLEARFGGLRVEDAGLMWRFEAAKVFVAVDLLRSLGGTPHLSLGVDTPRIDARIHLAEESKFELPDLVLDTVRISRASVSVEDLDSGVRFSVPDAEVQWVQGRGWGQAAGGSLQWKGAEERLHTAFFSGSRGLGILRVDQARLVTERMRVAASGRVGLEHLLDGLVDAEVRLWDLPDSWVKAVDLEKYHPVQGAVTVRGHVSGRVEEPRFDGRVSVGTGRFGPVAFEGASLALIATPTDLEFRDLEARSSAGGARQVAGRLSWSKGLELEVRGRALDFDLRPFMALFADGWFPVGIRGTGTFEAKGPLYPKLALACRLDAVGQGLDVTTEEDEGRQTWFALPEGRISSRCTVGEDELVFGPTVVDGGTMVVRMTSGRVDYHRGLDFQTDVEISNLDLVRQYLPAEGGPIDVRGRATGRFGGPYEALTFQYRLDMDSTVLFGKPVGTFQADTDFDLLDLTVRNGVLVGPLGRCEVSGTARLRSGGALSLDADWSEGDLSALADFIRAVVPSFPTEISGWASAVGRVVGTIEEPVFQGAVAAAEANVLGGEIEEARGYGALGMSHWEFDQLSLSAYGATAEVDGWADPDGFQVQGSFTGLSLSNLEKLAGTKLPVGATVSGTLEGGGSYENPRASFRGAFARGSVIGYAIGDGDVSGELEDRVATLDVRTHGGAGSAAVRIALDDKRPFAVDLEARKIPWGGLPTGLVPDIVKAESVTGRGRVEGQISGDERVSVRWQGTVAQARMDTVPLGDLGARLEYRAPEFQIFLQCWGGEAEADLTLRPGEDGVPMKVAVRARGLDLARLAALFPVPTGRVSARGEAFVDLDRLTSSEGWQKLEALLDLTLEGSAQGVVGPDWIRLPDFSFRAGSREGKLEVGVWAEAQGIDARVVVEDVAHLAWRAEAELKGTSLVSLFPQGHPLGPVEGTLDAAVEAGGTAGTVEAASAQGEARGLSWGPLAPSQWTWVAKLRDGLAAFDVREPRGLTASGSWDRAEGLRASLRLDAVSLTGWTKPGVLPADFGGEAVGSGQVHVPSSGEPSGAFRLQKLVVILPPVKVDNQGELAVTYRDGAVHLDNVKLAGDGFDFRATGRVVPGKTWDVKAKGKADLGLVARSSARVRAASGQFLAEVSVEGPWKNPEVQGPVEVLPGGRFALEGFELEIAELEAKGYLESSRGLLLDWLDAQLGDGRLHVEGLLGVEAFKPSTLRLLVELRDIAYEWPRDVRYVFDGDGIVTGTVERPEVRGELRLKEFLDKRRVNWKSAVLDFLKRKPREAEIVDAQRGVYVDVSVRGAQDLKVENNLADLSLGVDLRARGYLPRPPLLGRVEVQEGKVRFRMQEYDAMRSSVEFLGETQPVPLLDLHARTAVQQYQVSVDVSGPLDNYQVSLSSVPPLSQNDIVALLSVGATAEDVARGKKGSETTTAAEATSFVTGEVQDLLEGEVGDLFGFDQFQVDPVYSTTTQTTVPRVTVGKSITQALFARYSSSIGGEVQQDVELQYSLTPSVQLVGGWADEGSESKGSLSGKIRFRYTFR